MVVVVKMAHCLALKGATIILSLLQSLQRPNLSILCNPYVHIKSVTSDNYYSTQLYSIDMKEPLTLPSVESKAWQYITELRLVNEVPLILQEQSGIKSLSFGAGDLAYNI